VHFLCLVWYGRPVVAGNDYDKAVSGLKMVEAQLKNAKDQLKYTIMTAPVWGTYIKLIFWKTKWLIPECQLFP
jgi:hypothetical protein